MGIITQQSLQVIFHNKIITILIIINRINITENGDLYTFGENENGKLGLPQGDSQTYKPTRVNIPAPLETISCGGHHNIGLTKDGDVVAFGSNNNGELGFGKDVQCVAEPKILPDELFEGEKIRSVSCGDSHTAFITGNI